jgi:hypothetical protein
MLFITYLNLLEYLTVIDDYSTLFYTILMMIETPNRMSNKVKGKVLERGEEE